VPVYTRTALPVLTQPPAPTDLAAPRTPSPVILPGLVYGKAELVLALWLYDLVGGDFSAGDVRSTPPPDDGRRHQHPAA
jgi:hypothetical protein